jgi:hypothetical protein
MENQEENKKKVTADEINDINDENNQGRASENIEKSPSSTQGTTKFERDHGRTNRSLGESHEPGTTPGTGV